MSCNIGHQNSVTCECDCPEGYLGDNCQYMDANKIQWLLQNNETPKSLYDNGILLDSIYGKEYEGGYIFYLDTITGKGMVAALSEYIPYAPTNWGCPAINISAINNIGDCHGLVTCFQPIQIEIEAGAKIGDGFANTNAILAECNDTLNAASLCRSLGQNWFLPSRGELNQMYVNLHAKGFGNFENHNFLSSTEGELDYHIWTQSFANGQIIGTDKYVPIDFRAAKSF